MLTQIFEFPLISSHLWSRSETVLPDSCVVWAAPFLISGEIWKRALILYRVFRKLSFLNLPGFLWCEAIRIPAFFIFKKGACFQLPIISRSSLSGKGGFFRFRSKLPASEKRAPENMEVKSEGSNEFQIYENCSGIPFSYWPSRFRRKACMHGNSLVWRVSVPKPWFFVPRRGRGVYAHAIDEIIW